MLELKGIDAHYGSIQALQGIDLLVEAGEIVALIGANGAGKSTTLMVISCLIRPRRGELSYNGRPITGLAPDAIVQLGISQVPEGRRIFADLTVEENLDLGAFHRHDKRKITMDREQLYTLFPILNTRRRQLGGTLSGGEQQMLAIARALMARPRLLLLDEPSMGLAPLMTKQLFEIIKNINKEQQLAILLVEQNANLALRVADRGYVLENGRIVVEAAADALLDNPAIQKAYLGI